MGLEFLISAKPRINAHKNLKASSPIDKTDVRRLVGWKTVQVLRVLNDGRLFIIIVSMQKCTFMFVQSASTVKTPPEPPLKKKPEHAQIRMHHHCTSIRIWLVTRCCSRQSRLSAHELSSSPTRVSSCCVCALWCEVVKGVKRNNEWHLEHESKLSIRVSYVSVTKSTQATSPWAGSLVQWRSVCVLSLMTLPWFYQTVHFS